MDEQSQKVLAEIVAKEPVSLTESEIEFLRARRSYLSEEQRAVYKEFLAELEDKAVDLNKLNREKLDALATELGLNPAQYSNKPTLITAIQEKQAENQS
ncbi:MAG TPA: hypothetical protein VJ464_13425 [Blastocatellia bacterium]|nr:hypothetical protein [Blastocatellia bacterium]